MKDSTKLLLALDKITYNDLESLWEAAKLPIVQVIVPYKYNSATPMSRDEKVTIIVGYTTRVGREIWHRGDNITKTVADWVDLLS